MKLHSFLLHLVLFSGLFSASAEVVTPNDLLMTRQSYGEARLNQSISGKPLSIGGKIYNDLDASHVGTHATSMIPITIPQGTTTLTGACGVDDNAGGEGSVRFLILSGSECLWTSPIMKCGEAAKTFKIQLPAGAKKLYLLAHEVENNSSDHANWVDLRWISGNTEEPAALKSQKILHAKDFGIVPNTRKDQTVALAKALSAARSHPGCVLELPSGIYHFYRENALEMSFHISNHDQPKIHPISVPLIDLRNVTIKGNNSLFLFHGLVLPMVIMDSSNVKVDGIALDYERPYYSEAVIVGLSEGETEVHINKKDYPYTVKNNRLSFQGEGWVNGVNSGMIFQKNTGHILENTSDYGGTPHVTELPNGNLKFNWNLQEKKAQPGDIITLRTWARPHPAICIYRAENTVLKNVPMHSSLGMTLLAQRSENIYITGGGSYPRPATKRAHSASADATHFSNTKGKIIVENSTFKGMMDDAINVHSTCLSIEEILSPTSFRAVYKHGQAIGFELFLPGETLRYIAGKTLEEGALAQVKNVRKLNSREVIIDMATELPKEIKVGDAIENADYQPEVVFRKNVVGNNRARGSLFTTPKKVLVENNIFDHSSGSAILLAGDAQGWYESGACHDVTIRNNKFINNLTSRYQFTNAIISICPEVRKLKEQTKYYHRNVLIEKNEFQTFDVPLLFAVSTEGLTFKENKIIYNNDFKGWGQKPFHFNRCSNVKIIHNSILPNKHWTLKDIKWENSSERTVIID